MANEPCIKCAIPQTANPVTANPLTDWIISQSLPSWLVPVVLGVGTVATVAVLWWLVKD